VFDESLKSEVCDLGREEIIFIDFLGIENFLPNSPTKDVDVNVNSYTVGENFIFKEKEIFDPF